MTYQIYQMEFLNGVRFGTGSLDSTEITFHADTLFSALFQEAVKLDCADELLTAVKNGSLLFSDAFPYIGKNYYIPKPIVNLKLDDQVDKGNSNKKKQFKNLKYIPAQYLEDYLKGIFPESHMADMKDIGKYSMKVSVAIRGYEEPQPYRVKAFHFTEGTGLYIITKCETKEMLDLLERLLDSLSYTGLGGKKSSGLGRFEYMRKALPEVLQKSLDRTGSKNILLSAALPEDEELPAVMKNASYNLLKRSGFVDSQTYAEQQMKKRDLYVFAPGSCFEKCFAGKLIHEKNGGSHVVYRCEKALFMGVDV